MKETSPKSNNGTILDINESFKIEFDPISDALAAIRNGECIIVVDDERRENEGDLICAAQFATPQQINFMATEGRGLICLAMQGEKLDSLDQWKKVYSKEAAIYKRNDDDLCKEAVYGLPEINIYS